MPQSTNETLRVCVVCGANVPADEAYERKDAQGQPLASDAPGYWCYCAPCWEHERMIIDTCCSAR